MYMVRTGENSRGDPANTREIGGDSGSRTRSLVALPRLGGCAFLCAQAGQQGRPPVPSFLSSSGIRRPSGQVSPMWYTFSSGE